MLKYPAQSLPLNLQDRNMFFFYNRIYTKCDPKDLKVIFLVHYWVYKISYLSILFIWVLAVSKIFKGRMLFKTAKFKTTLKRVLVKKNHTHRNALVCF